MLVMCGTAELNLNRQITGPRVLTQDLEVDRKRSLNCRDDLQGKKGCVIHKSRVLYQEKGQDRLVVSLKNGGAGVEE